MWLKYIRTRKKVQKCIKRTNYAHKSEKKKTMLKRIKLSQTDPVPI